MASKKHPKATSCRGVFVFPRLNGEPDYRFNKEGTYGTKLRLDPNDDKAKAFMGWLDEQTGIAFDAIKEEQPKHAKKLLRVEPYTMETDKEGNETGFIIIGFSMKASVVAKQGKNVGKTFNFKPILFDSVGKPITDDKLRIGGGTEGKISFEYFPYFSPPGPGVPPRAGLSKRLQAAQIIKLVEWGGGNAASFGFGDEGDEDGFSAPANAAANNNSTESDEGDDEEGNGDF